MGGAPDSYEEYVAELEKRLNKFERFSDKATGIDDRLDLLAKIQIEQLRFLKSSNSYRPGPATGAPSYSVKMFPLDEAREDVEVGASGNSITAYTDGDISGCSIRLDNLVNDAIPLSEFRCYIPSGFQKFWLQTDAQPGKYLRLKIDRGSSLDNYNLDRPVHIETIQKVGLYLQPEWAAKEGTDKNLLAEADDVPTTLSTYVTYNVPAVKTLVITHFGFAISAEIAADRDNNQIGGAWIRNETDSETLASIGGNGGGAFILPKPAIIPGGKQFRATVQNRSNHNCVILVSAHGYEL